MSEQRFDSGLVEAAEAERFSQTAVAQAHCVVFHFGRLVLAAERPCKTIGRFPGPHTHTHTHETSERNTGRFCVETGASRTSARLHTPAARPRRCEWKTLHCERRFRPPEDKTKIGVCVSVVAETFAPLSQVVTELAGKGYRPVAAEVCVGVCPTPGGGAKCRTG